MNLLLLKASVNDQIVLLDKERDDKDNDSFLHLLRLFKYTVRSETPEELNLITLSFKLSLI